MTGPYTPKRMDAARSGEDIRTVRDARIDGLRAEASEAVGYSANTLRTVGQRYRTAYADEFARWQALRDELDSIERGRPGSHGPRPDYEDRGPDEAAISAAEAGAEDARIRALRTDVDAIGRELGRQQTELAKLEIALRSLESTWLFLERGDSSLVSDTDGLPSDVQMRIVEAQESERSRLAQEVHDGPAQVLSNAIFQVEYIERVLDTDLRAARTELRFLRDLLRRELGSVRTFISQLRPPVLDELGLDGAIADAIGRTTALTGLAISSELAAPPDRLTGTQQTVVLRVLQEALQNVRKHGAASAVTVATAIDAGDLGPDGPGRRPRLRRRSRGCPRPAQLRAPIHARARRTDQRLLRGAFTTGRGTLVRLAIPVGAEETSS